MKFHIENLINIYREKDNILIKELKKIPFIEVVYHINGRFYIWIKLNDEIDSSKFYLKCKENKILLLSGNIFFLDNQKNLYFRVSFATINIQEIIDGVNRLKNVDLKKIRNNFKKKYT